MESKILSCGESAIIKSAFHKETTSLNINEIKLIKQYYLIKHHMEIKVHLSTTLGIDTLMESFCR